MSFAPRVPPASLAGPRAPRAAARAAAPGRQPSSIVARPAALIQLIDAAITGLVLLAVASIFTMSAGMLTHWKIHYMTSGGNFYEKLHPATYFAVLAFILLAIRQGDPVGDIIRMFSGAKLLLFYLLCWVCLLVQMVLTERPFTVIIDTFLLPLLLCLVIWQLSSWQRRPIIWVLHLTILINIVIGFYEYHTGHRLIPLTLGNVVVTGEWRASALLGHPLTASGVIAGYIIALVFRPAICPPAIVRLPLIALSLASLMAFGGRTSLVTVLIIMGIAAGLRVLRVLCGGRTSVLAVVGAICLVFVGAALIFIALDHGIFDKMLLRFSSDKGSTSARYATFSLLSHFQWQELILGPDPVRASALQTAYGLKFGIEDFWISSIVQFGIVSTVLLTFGLAGLFTEILKRATGAAWLILLLITIIAASSVSFSSKNIQLAQFAALITLLLPRERKVAPLVSPQSRPRPVPAYA
ncbi:VpsF family polysaccharide biosynthesis protein [Bradyrhizobium sp. STM 3562]|uniref:VpsF family polysaccharide biosynthesis protein n=1 Tax=Bradyrhizobium sp. STM 3562 TaxID=578924 RepID=UPI00388E49F0